MEPIVASLWSSFRHVPPAAIPAMIDCILASTSTTPSSYFTALLHEFPRLSKDIMVSSKTTDCEWRNCVVSYVAALSHFLKKSGAHHMPTFIEEMLLPLLKLLHACECHLFNEVASLFLDVVSETNSWEVLEMTMVPFLLRSIGLSVGMCQSEELAIYSWSENSFIERSRCKEVIQESADDDSQDRLSKQNTYEDSVLYHHDFSLLMSCNLLTLTLDAVVQITSKSVINGLSSSQVLQAKDFAGRILLDLSNLTLQMLSTSLEHRSTATKFLLPFIFKAFLHECTYEVSVHGAEHVLTRDEIFIKVWQCCKSLFSLGSLERSDAYDILSLYLSFSPNDDHQDVNVGRGEKTFDLSTDHIFWDEIKRGLLDKESLVRKQSIYILKRTLNLGKPGNCFPAALEKGSHEGSSDSSTSKRGRWADTEAMSLGIGKICSKTVFDVTGQEKWEPFVFLYEMLEEYGTHLVEAAWNHQIMVWLQLSISVDNSSKTASGELICDKMGSIEQTFEWLAVLWERGFCHDNPQVRCFIMQSFLAFEWETHGCHAKFVPKSFILGPLVRGLNDPVHHKDFGLKEIYSSWSIEAASRFVCQYTGLMEERQHISFMLDLASVPKTHAFSRAGLICLAECIASAANGVLKQNNHEIKGFSTAITDSALVKSAPRFYGTDRSDLLDILRFVLECSKHHFNPKYRSKVCEKVLAAATALITATDVPLEILLNFIFSLPLEFIDYGGSLRYVVQKWLRGSNLQLLEAICELPEKFISFQYSLDSPITYNDEEIDAWISEANRWARVFFLVAKEDDHFYPIIQFINDHIGDICKPKYNLQWLDVKFCILVTVFVQKLQDIQQRTTITADGFNFPGILQNPSVRKQSVVSEKLAQALLSFMEELILFTELSCSIFWSVVETEDMILPGVVRGRLGGPSQRRLSSSLCTSVLKAITSVKTLASVSMWSSQFKADVNCAQPFLWNFCWKIIRFRTCKSEVEAEVCIAAHEACNYALKHLVPVFSSSSLDLVDKDNALPLEGDENMHLDLFLSTFIHNINDVIDGGSLARARRAVLMNLKWSCIESLLSLPNYALYNGVDPKRCNVYFTETVLRHVFDDLVGSLENAGEVSVLPMLRSVRLCIEFLSSKRTDPVIDSCAGISIQMMWLLVRSSWILHVNCNKRRVAPIAALLSSVLHSSVFGDEGMHELDSEPGPLKWFVEKILEEGTRSPRTIRLAALHLSGLWLAYPNILKYYMKELKLLTFYGSVAFDEDFEGELSENLDAKTEVSTLSKSLDSELTEVFINTELYARVSVAVLFSKLADVADLALSDVANEDALPVIASGKMFLLELLDSVVNDKDLSKELYKKYSAIHRRKVRAWQMICVLSRFVDVDILEQVTSSLYTSIYRNNLPSVRQYMETFAIYVYLKFPALVGQELVYFLRSYDLRSQALSSYVYIAANVILHTNKDTQSGHLDELLPCIIPLLTSHHHTLRGFAQILVFKVLQNVLPIWIPDACHSFSLEKRCFVDLRSYLERNSDCARLRVSMESHVDVFDPIKSISPAGIFTNRIEEHEFECVSTTLMDRVIGFLHDAREDLRSSMAQDAAAIKKESFTNDKGSKIGGKLHSNGEESVAQLPKEIFYDFQKKISVLRPDLQDSISTTIPVDGAFYRSLLSMENEDQLFDQLLQSKEVMVDKAKSSRQQIIVQASLIDRIPNLAGLARTCEVFRAAGLAIADKNVLNDKQFQLISVTAEKWVPLLEVPVESMKIFLEKKKQEGFAILGLEQTANSTPLDQFKFHIKTVLVLGREKEGIPVEIIHMLDACIEIPQLGVVRSLNVHVSGAIALWEYTRQRRLQ